MALRYSLLGVVPPNAGTHSFETTHNRLDFLIARPERTL